MKTKKFSLNQRQKEAVEYNQGPLLIIAGAGTGKTTVIANKVRFLILKELARPENILALTFTEKAAFDMEERVDQNLPYGYFQMSISTFHSFADQVLKQEASHIGIPLGYKLLNKAESVIFLRDNLFLFNLKYFRPLGNPNKFIEALLQHFSRLQDEDISPEEYLRWARKKEKDKQLSKEERKKNIELAEAYKMFQVLKIKHGYLDFSDLISYLVKLFRQRKNILKKYQEQFPYILVDEFQDTNIAQYELIKLLAPADKNPFLTVVGDDSQAIYKFRGASISNIQQFKKDYPQAKQISLIKNYRSIQPILDVAYRLIKHNDPDTLEAKLGISKKLISVKRKTKSRNNDSYLSKPINFFLAQTPEEEADFVAEEILKLNKLEKTNNFNRFAILVRANNHAEAFIRSFIRKGIPYQFLGPAMLYKQPEIKDLIAYLKVLYNLEDSVALYRVLSMDIFNLDAKDLSLLLSFAKKINLPLFQTIEAYLSFFDENLYRKEFEIYKKYIPLIKKETRKTLSFIYRMITRHLKRIKKDTAGQILYYFLEDTKYLNRLVDYKNEKEERKALNISKFFNKLKTYETEHEDSSIFAVVDYLKMSMELGESPIIDQVDINSYNAVNILTVHSSKGLEFPVVFMVNLAKGRFPSYERREALPIPTELIKEILPQGNYHLQEERRLFYVGLTRAMEKVYLTTSKFYGQGKQQRKPSPFVTEALGEKLNQFETSNQWGKNQLTIFDFKKQKETVIKQPVVINQFSFSQIETYQRCPLQYKYKYILKIPTPPNAAASFGTTLHLTLMRFYRQFMKNKNITKKRLLEIYDKTWIPVGYSSLSHQKKYKQQGKIMLEGFFDKLHHKKIKILDLEKLFKIKINPLLSVPDNDKEKKDPLLKQPLVITGKIDRVDLTPDTQTIEIIDYKTGKPFEEKRVKENQQLSIYALAATDKRLYKKTLKQVKLTFYFLQNLKKVSIKKTNKELDKTKKSLIKTAGEIKKGLFPSNPGPHCDFCQFRIICEAWQ